MKKVGSFIGDWWRLVVPYFKSEERWIELTIARGQLQYLDNRRFAHARTPFTDGGTPETRRHLIRLWTRDAGRRTFHG